MDMKRRTLIRLAIASAILIVTTIGGWIGRREVEKYAANKLLFGMVKINDLEGVAWAIEAGADVNAEDEDGDTPLHHAVDQGHQLCPG